MGSSATSVFFCVSYLTALHGLGRSAKTRRGTFEVPDFWYIKHRENLNAARKGSPESSQRINEVLRTADCKHREFAGKSEKNLDFFIFCQKKPG